MEAPITLLARLAKIDVRLAELHDDLGDLPAIVRRHEEIVRNAAGVYEATETAIRDLEQMRTDASLSLQELAENETKLGDNQFRVKNNREFDAITNELEHIRSERSKLDEQLRTAGVKLENLNRTLESARIELSEAQTLLREKTLELDAISGEHNEELRKLISNRLVIIAELDDSIEAEYERIRSFHPDAAVSIRKNSCSGCYSAVPSQRIMEMKYNREKVYICESCGRILFTEDIAIEIAAEEDD